MESIIKDNLYTNNWFNYKDFYRKVSANTDYKVYVEVGVWKGHSLSFLAQELKPRKGEVKIYGVDLFENTYKWDNPEQQDLRQQVPYIYEIYNKVLEAADVRDDIIDLKGISWEMADQFEDGTVDMVFIDADHSYESVVKDISAWLPKIRKGGIISGHDYNNPCGVKQAVSERFTDYVVENNVWQKLI